MNQLPKSENAPLRIISSAKNWIEGEALRQLERAAGLSSMAEVVGLPDLQPGKGYPVGAVFACRDRIYPYLVGNDIGCGVALWQTNLAPKKIKIDRLRKRLEEDHCDDSSNEALAPEHEQVPMAGQLGSMGGGNHFAEVQLVDTIMLPECFAGLGLDRDRTMLLVHSGSRGLGEMILRRHVDQFKDQGLPAASSESADYLKSHDQALAWAKENRKRIAASLLGCLGADGEPVLDLPHNFISQEEIDGKIHWLHRKGAIAVGGSAQGAIGVIPGSRGALTYLVRPVGNLRHSLFSLPHGAGRKWQRAECRGKLERRFRPNDLYRTELGGHVFCQDKELLYEEAPQAYKDITVVIDSLITAGLVEVIATLRPLMTIKRKGLGHDAR